MHYKDFHRAAPLLSLTCWHSRPEFKCHCRHDLGGISALVVPIRRLTQDQFRGHKWSLVINYVSHMQPTRRWPNESRKYVFFVTMAAAKAGCRSSCTRSKPPKSPSSWLPSYLVVVDTWIRPYKVTRWSQGQRSAGPQYQDEWRQRSLSQSCLSLSKQFEDRTCEKNSTITNTNLPAFQGNVKQ